MSEATPPRRRRAPRALVAALLLAAATVFGVWRAPRLAATPRAADVGWSVRDAHGEVLRLPVDGGGLPLRPGRELHLGSARDASFDRTALADPDAEPGRPDVAARVLADVRAPLREIRARVAPRDEQSSRVELLFRDAVTEYRLALIPAGPPSATLSSRREAGDWRLDAEAQLPAGAVREGGLLEAERPFDLRVTLAPGRVALAFDGAPLLDHAAPDFEPPRHARLWIDVADVLALDVRRGGDALTAARDTVRDGATGATGDAERDAPALHLDVARWAADARGSARTRAALEALGLALLGALFVGTRAAWTRCGAQAAVGATLLVVAAATLGAWSAERARVVARDHAAWRAELSDAAFTLDAPRTLHLGNALAVPGSRRDLTLRARLRVEPGAVLELGARVGAGEAAPAVALVLGDRGRYGAAFVRHDAERFELLAERDVAVPTDRALELELRVRGDRYAATLDGAPLLDARCDAVPVGALRLLAVAGRVHVDALHVEPAPFADDAPAPLGSGLGTALAVVLAGLLLAAWTSRWRGAAFAHALAASAPCWVPPALVGAWVLEGEALTPEVHRALLVVAAGVGALSVASLRGRVAASSARALPAVALGAALPTCALLLLVPAPAAPALADARRLDLFPGPRLSQGLASFEHPTLRRYNTWLASHRFRGLEFEPRKPPGTLRVITAGSSSTVGYGLPPSAHQDYPSQLWRALRRELPGQSVQVLNGAVSSSSSARLLRFFREVLAEFEPDVVTLSFSFNDSGYLTRFDEHAWLERVESPDFVLDAATRRSTAEELARGNTRWRELRAAFAEHGPPSLPLWDARADTAGLRAPPERFAASLRDWARACEAVGARLVLVKEPVRDDLPLLWKQEFRAALDAVAVEFGLPVLDPTPALLAAGDGAQLFMDEVHPSAAGHAVLARELAAVVAPLLRERVERR